jgi:hypothetical protein
VAGDAVADAVAPARGPAVGLAGGVTVGLSARLQPASSIARAKTGASRTNSFTDRCSHARAI